MNHFSIYYSVSIGIISDWQFSDNCVTLCIFVDPIYQFSLLNLVTTCHTHIQTYRAMWWIWIELAVRLCEAYNKILTQNTHNRLSNVGAVVSQVADSSKSLHIHTHKEEHTYSHSNMCTTLLDCQRRPCSLSLLSILSDMLKIKTRKLNHFVIIPLFTQSTGAGCGKT